MITSPRSDDSLFFISAGPIPAGALSFGSLSAFPSNGALMPSSGQEVVLPHDSVGQWASSQHQQPMFSAVNSQVWLMELSC